MPVAYADRLIDAGILLARVCMYTSPCTPVHNFGQHPRRRDRDGAKQLTLTFSGDERSDWLNFVLKDGDSWYDNKGTNFHVPLQSSGTMQAEPQRQQQVRMKS